MPHRQRASDKDLWSRTLSLVFLGFLCYAFPWSVFAAPLPIPTDDTPALRIQGSNTIGAKLLPALVQGLMEGKVWRISAVPPENGKTNSICSARAATAAW